MNDLLNDYIKAKGSISRKPFNLALIVLVVFNIITQMYFIQRSQALGITVERPEDILMPFWGIAVILFAFAALIPGVIMRARDAGWPTWAFGGLYGAHVLFMALHRVLHIEPLPAMVAFVLQGMTLFAIIALMIRPTQPEKPHTNKEN
mgnify:CR=1 FL=1